MLARGVLRLRIFRLLNYSNRHWVRAPRVSDARASSQSASANELYLALITCSSNFTLTLPTLDLLDSSARVFVRASIATAVHVWVGDRAVRSSSFFLSDQHLGQSPIVLARSAQTAAFSSCTFSAATRSRSSSSALRGEDQPFTVSSARAGAPGTRWWAPGATQSKRARKRGEPSSTCSRSIAGQ